MTTLSTQTSALAAIVFDLDGTLVETAADLHAVLAEILAERGLAAPPLDAVRGMIGDGARVLIERAFMALGYPADPPLVAELHERFLVRYAEVPCRASHAYAGAHDVLEDLAARGLRLGLCTNKPQAATEGLLRALDLHRFFNAIVGGDQVERRKPDPAHLQAVLDHLGADPASAVMVGDSRNDVLAARALGLPCILVSWGYTLVPVRELRPEAMIDRFADLPTALQQLSRF